jgi:hypothetical protein
MTTAATPKGPRLDTKRLVDFLPPVPFRGGWSSEPNDDEKSHYFRIYHGLDPDDNGNIPMVTLCGKYEADGKPEDLVDCDPLALENCLICRRALLENRRLI